VTRPTLAVAIALAVLLAAAAVVLALVTDDGPTGPAGQPPAPDGPLAMPAFPAPGAGSAGCRALLDRLPESLTTAGGARLQRRELAAPAPAGVAAWGQDRSPVTLRCGIERPAELTRTAPLLDVSGVRWLRLPGQGFSTWVAVDRAVYVGLTFGDDAGTGPLQEVSEAVTGALPAQRVQPSP
jgi:Protein of unknown function (DUF3515)